MLKESSFLIRIKIFADLFFIASIIVATRFAEFQHSFFSQGLFVYVLVNLIVWFVAARSFSLYDDLRMKPISVEWVMFLKAFGIFTLVKSFIFFQVLDDFSFEKYPS